MPPTQILPTKNVWKVEKGTKDSRFDPLIFEFLLNRAAKTLKTIEIGDFGGTF